MEELKPCPFCGGEAIMQAPNMHRVTCISCRDCMASSKWGKIEEIISMWNRRTDDGQRYKIHTRNASVGD